MLTGWALLSLLACFGVPEDGVEASQVGGASRENKLDVRSTETVAGREASPQNPHHAVLNPRHVWAAIFFLALSSPAGNAKRDSLAQRHFVWPAHSRGHQTARSGAGEHPVYRPPLERAWLTQAAEVLDAPVLRKPLS